VSGPSDWLAGLPEHWARRPLGRECWVRARLGWKGLKADEYVDIGGYPMLATPDIKGRQIEFTNAARISEARFAESPEIMLRRGDVLLTKDGSTIGTLNLVRQLPEPATVNGSIAVLTPSRRLHGPFLYYVLASRYADAVFRYLTDGAGVPHLFQRDINRIAIPMPPLDEQRRIADFLDAETAQIDTLIAEQERFIGLLRERRVALVASEIPMPEDSPWPVDKLGRFTEVRSGSTPRRDNAEYWSGGDVPWLTSTVVNLPAVESASEFVTRTAVRECHLPEVEPGSLLVGLIGQGPTRGMATITRISSTLSQNLAYITPDRSRWFPEYLLWSLRASYGAIRQRGAESGAAQPMLNTDDIRKHRLAMPPLVEQKRIADLLEGSAAGIDALIAEAHRNIELSKERRAALIAAAVTGKTDVSTGRAA
jgi:type I restriction enzyme S subunit